MPIERKLTAIVFTDIVGFTELSAQDEENAFALIATQSGNNHICPRSSIG